MASLSLPTPIEARAPLPINHAAADPNEELLLVASFGDPAAADYVEYTCKRGKPNIAVVADAGVCRRVEAPARTYPLEGFSQVALQAATGHAEVGALILFLNSRLTENDRRVLADLFRLAAERKAKFVGLVSTFRVHLGDHDAAESEAHVLSGAEGLGTHTVVFRPGHVLSPRSRAGSCLRRFAFFYPLVPRRLRSCCVEGDELFAAIEAERQAPRPRRARIYTLLGPNRPWRDLMAQHRAKGLWRACLTAVSTFLGLLLIGQLAGLVFDLLARRRPALRHWNFDTIRPGSFRELLALCNKYNCRHVKVVGYNNGVIHFGHRYPGKTVLSTVHCHRVAMAGAGQVKADCGATVRQALDFLAGAGQELYVVPNYSYVCLGTSFFVPIHGSAADFSTVAETITKVILYDPERDRLVATARDEPTFRNHVYNQDSGVVLLRLYLRVRPKSRYYIHKEVLQDPGSEELLGALRDGRATNVEIRQAKASSSQVTVCKYYKDPGETPSPVLELPRDSLGGLWDRLEENPVTSFLMHALTRHFAWHVELFFTAAEFATFWRSHHTLPLHKIQLRYIRRDGLPHSPFRENDCVSADLVMLRRHRRRFETYLGQTFGVVRTNPGKHSR